MNSRPRLLVLASGSKTGGGSGFRLLANHASPLYTGKQPLAADLVGVVSNHEQGGVRRHATAMGVPFTHFPKTMDTAEGYQDVVARYAADYVALSGWLKLVKGLDPRKVLNIHPGPFPVTKGLHGHGVHEKMIAEFLAGRATHSAVTMHFATEVYDDGPVCFQIPVPIMGEDDADSLGKRVNTMEHEVQVWVTNLVVTGEISWDGKKGSPVVVPDAYPYTLPLEKLIELDCA